MSLSASAAARQLLRRSALQPARAAGRRFESTSTRKAADAARDTASKASEYKDKAAQGLSRVTSAAGPAIVGAAKSVSGALGRVGGRTGRLIAFIERQVPFVVYYSRVGLELSKIVFRGQKMSPPSAQTFQSYWQRVLGSLRNPSALLQPASQGASLLQQVRGITRAQIIGGGVLLAELLGFFTAGEMIGRFKLIGYHGETAAAHH